VGFVGGEPPAPAFTFVVDTYPTVYELTPQTAPVTLYTTFLTFEANGLPCEGSLLADGGAGPVLGPWVSVPLGQLTTIAAPSSLFTAPARLK
jgi:hypothetical protein